jgi:hypothetical protein
MGWETPLYIFLSFQLSIRACYPQNLFGSFVTMLHYLACKLSNKDMQQVLTLILALL